jgi:3'-5' exoribonuclease
LKQYIKDLKVGDSVRGVFRATDADLKTAGAWRLMTLNLSDRTGHIQGVRKSVDTELVDAVRGWKFAHVSGHVDAYNDRPQVVITAIKRVEPEAVDMADFVAVGRIPLADLNKRQASLSSSIQCPYLSRLWEVLMGDQGHWHRFSMWPAAISHHHAYMHGLLEHSVEVATMVSALCHVRMPDERPVNRDLAVAGALLHDLGKIEEYAYADGVTTRTDIGHKRGHIVLGYDMVKAAIEQVPDFPEQLADDLLHIILSHHAKLEWGSPVAPAFEEAALVAYADQMSAAAGKAREATDKAAGEMWTRLEGGYWWTGRRQQEAP